MKDIALISAVIIMSALACFCETQARRAIADSSQLRETLRENVATIGNLETRIAVYKVQNTGNMTRIALLQELLYGKIPPRQPPIQMPGFKDPSRGWVQPPEPNDG
jgi:hypothetical protein